jgi:hypothetical protein
MVIGPLQGLVDDWAGESFGWVDADELGRYAAFGCPGVCFGCERVVNPVSGLRPANLITAGSLPRGWNGVGGKRITGRSGIWSSGARSRLALVPHAVAHTIWNRVASSCSHGPCAAHSRTGSSPGKNSCSV